MKIHKANLVVRSGYVWTILEMLLFATLVLHWYFFYFHIR